MAEYIERKLLIDEFDRLGLGDHSLVERVFSDGVRTIIAGIPAADVAPVVHGRWDDSGRYTFPSGNTAVRCTNCGCALTESEYHLYDLNYCPICGARMDGDSDALD